MATTNQMAGHDPSLLGLPPVVLLRILQYSIADFKFDTSKLGTKDYYCPPVMVTCKQLRAEFSEPYIKVLSDEVQRACNDCGDVLRRIEANERSRQIGQQSQQGSDDHYQLLKFEWREKDDEFKKVHKMEEKEMALLDEERLQALGIKTLSKRKVETGKASEKAGKTGNKKPQKSTRKRRRG